MFCWSDGDAFEFATEDLKADREFLMEAVKCNGYVALEHSAEGLRTDRELWIEAVKHDGHAFEYAPDVLKADQEFLKDAVSLHPDTLLHLGALLAHTPVLDCSLYLAIVRWLRKPSWAPAYFDMFRALHHY